MLESRSVFLLLSALKSWYEYFQYHQYHRVRSHERRNKLKLVSEFISVSSLLVFTWIEAKWNSKQYGFHIGHFYKNETLFWVVKYNANTTRNEMPTYVHQNIGVFWNAAEMKRHVNRACYHACLKSQTGMSSFRLSCERNHNLNLSFLKHLILFWYLLNCSCCV